MTAPHRGTSALIVGPDGAVEYLAGLGIEVELIREAVKQAERRAAEIGEFHPRGAAGVTRWITTVGSLRRAMVTGGGWRRDDVLNRPTCHRDDGKVILSVVGGTASTGDVAAPVGPRAANKRGPATIVALKDQLELITVAALTTPGRTPRPGDPAPEGQWFVLYHRAQNEVRIEVSKALGIDADGQFTGWVVRVLLEPYSDDRLVRARPSDVGGEDVDFTIVPVA